MRNAQRDIDALIDQVHGPVDQIEPRRHRRIGVEKIVQDRTQYLLAADDWRRQSKRAARG
jgi:hypothetical protein